MSEFTSKLQYKTYEKGEYSDEKVRSLEETLLLINNFPWEEQRGVDIQLTGPSVTIQDEYGNYLKAALYFRGKFCLYYLDLDHHLYEYHTPELKDVCAVVVDFFNGHIDLDKFERNLFSIGNKNHFTSNDFVYRVRAWRVILLSWGIIIFFLIFTIFVFFIVQTTAPFIVILVPGLLSLFMAGILLYILNRYLACSNQFLQVSKGNSVFSFGNDTNEQTYDKSEIKEIILFGPLGTRSPNTFYVFEIYFKDKSVIKFSNMLISDTTFMNKFSTDLIVYSKRSSFWLL